MTAPTPHSSRDRARERGRPGVPRQPAQRGSARRALRHPARLQLDRFLEASRADGTGLRAELNVDDDEVLLVYVGRLVPIKRVDVLLRAFAQARSAGARAKLAVVGGGELRDELGRQAAQLGVDEWVHFLGFRSDLDVVYAAADVALLSSDNEGTPVALIEAAAAGIPGLATDVGGVAEVVTPGTGLLVPPGDVDRLAARIDRSSQDRSALRRGPARRRRDRPVRTPAC